jgi:hypothetical protein
VSLLVKGYYATVANISLTYKHGFPILLSPESKLLSNEPIAKSIYSVTPAKAYFSE